MYCVSFSVPCILKNNTILYKLLLFHSLTKINLSLKNKPFDRFLIFLFPNDKECLIYNCRPESKQEPVKTEMGPPPSPASTCSDASSIASSASMPYSKFYV